MSDRPQGEDWWMASDGKWYPPQSRPDYSPSPQGPAAPTGPPSFVPTGLTMSIRVVAWVTAAFGVAAAAATANEVSKFDAYIEQNSDARLAALVDAEDLSQGIFGVAALFGIALGVLLIIWLYKSYKAIDRFGAMGTRWSPGWAVGGWFIPFANLVIPKLVLNEIDRISNPERPIPRGERWKSVRTLAVSNWWWGVLITGIILVQVGAGITAAELDAETFDADPYRAGLWLQAAGMVITALGTVLGARVVQVIGARLEPDPAAPPYGATVPVDPGSGHPPTDPAEWWE